MEIDHCGAPERSGLGRAYREHLARAAVRVEDLTRGVDASRLLRITYHGRFLPTPVFLSAAERAALAEDLGTLHRLLTGLPERRFGGDTGALAEALGVTAPQARLARRAATGPPPARLARADLYRAAEGFRLLELNISSALGGANNALLNRALLDHPALARFAAEHRLGYVDTVRHLAAIVRAECGPLPERPVVALADWPTNFATFELWLHVFASLLDEAGIEAVPCHVGELVERAGRLEVQGRPVDAVLRMFLIEQVRTPQDEALLEPLLRTVESGAVRLISRLDAELYGNKGALALLSDDRHRDTLDAAERACLDRLLPWTRFLRPRLRLPDGSVGDAEAYARAEQRNLVLKPVLSHSGIGVLPGWTVPPAEWLDRVRRAVGGPYVLQRRVTPVPEVFPAPDGGERAFHLNWGVFVTDPSVTGSDGYGGCYLRASDAPEAGVITESPDGWVGCVFHQEAAPGGDGDVPARR
ncbi:hypothetical protein [Kitasatospora sp. NPDC086791]|uniref:hypothetical protein n=1 Tax=Kitasatospora sp. NPDC086791 TaxID=3155178 RepID=UPI003423B946